jgi:hypothetical protein
MYINKKPIKHQWLWKYYKHLNKYKIKHIFNPTLQFLYLSIYTYFKIRGSIINKVTFADDTAIIGKTQEELQDMVTDWLTLEGGI